MIDLVRVFYKLLALTRTRRSLGYAVQPRNRAVYDLRYDQNRPRHDPLSHREEICGCLLLEASKDVILYVSVNKETSEKIREQAKREDRTILALIRKRIEKYYK